MSYTDRPGYNQPSGYGEPGYSAADAAQAVDYHDRVRWGPIFGGLVTAISLQLVLSALGAAVGLDTLDGRVSASEARGVGIGVGIWTIISVLISLFLGGYAMARACGPMSRSSALLNGAILWSTTLAISSWLLASGVAGTFGAVLANAGSVANQVLEPGGANIPTNVPSPNLSANQAANTAADANWWFALGCLLSLLAAIAGATAGTRKVRNGSARA